MDKHSMLESIQEFVPNADHDDEDAVDEQDYDIAYDNLAVPEIHTGKAKPQHTQPAEKPRINYDTAIPEVNVRRVLKNSQAKDAGNGGDSPA